MAQIIAVTVQNKSPEATATNAKAAVGKALARESDRLDFAAKRCNVTAITALLSESPDVLAAHMREEGFDPSKMRLPPEQWFDPAEGLKTVQGLATFVNANLNNFKQPNPILRDLKAVEATLVAVEAAGGRFHFTKTSI